MDDPENPYRDVAQNFGYQLSGILDFKNPCKSPIKILEMNWKILEVDPLQMAKKICLNAVKILPRWPEKSCQSRREGSKSLVQNPAKTRGNDEGSWSENPVKTAGK